MLNFNTDPYRDDFDPTKHFHRILFKPGRAVQARELTQSQTILQDQISKFAANLFTQNTPITGGNVTINKNVQYIKLQQSYNNIELNVYDFLNRNITDQTGTVIAKVLAVTEATIVNNVVTDSPTLVVSYLSGNHFSENQVIYSLDDFNYTAKIAPSNATGNASTAHIAEGVFYIVNGYSYSDVKNPDGSYTKYSIGNFVGVDPQTIVLDKYGNAPSLRIGLNIVETVHDYIDDVSLLDPAIGASNYQAPGADRYVINLQLETRPLDLGDDQNFVELVRVEKGEIKKQVDGTVYSVIDDYFAKRTYETNGDYIVHNFKLTPSTNVANTQQYILGVGKGLAYVRGYRAENQSGISLTGDKARTYSTISRNNNYVDYGSYIYVYNVTASNTASFDTTTYQSVDLHVVPTANIAQANVANSYNSTVAATARLRGLEFNHYKGIAANTKSYVFAGYLCDIQTKTISSNVTTSSANNTITFYDPYSKFSNSNNCYVGVNLTLDAGPSAGDSRTITSWNGQTKTAIVNSPFSSTPNANTTLTLHFGTKDIETMVIANSTYKVVASAIVDESSRVGGLSTGDTLVKDSSYPELLFNIGSSYIKSISNSYFTTQTLFRKKDFSAVPGKSQLQLTFDTGLASILNFNGTTSGVLSESEILSLMTVVVRNPGTNTNANTGEILDFTNYPNRSVTVSSDRNTLTFNATDLTTPLTVDVYVNIEVNNADNTGHVLKTKALVQANQNVTSNTSGTAIGSNTFVDLVNGQVYIQKPDVVAPGQKQSLYVADVKRIVKIIDTGDITISPQLSMLSSSSYDVTSYYDFNNGQTDNYYDHAYLTLKPGYPKAKGNLLILLDYYFHGGGDGYFSVMSYLGPTSSSPESYEQIPSYTAKNGTVYNLRDSLDFRPSRQNATKTFKFEYTTDPATTDAGIYIPKNLTNFICDYNFYLGRKDLLILTKERKFQLIQGVPSINPTYPSQPDGSLLIAKIILDPYTAYVPGENILPNLFIETIQHKRWTMQDISDLEMRVENIEYYTTLNALEQKTQNLQIPDSNGINRFKNGMIVDDFSSFSAADTSNPDFFASINKRTFQMSAAQRVTNFPLQSIDVLNSGRNLYSSGYVVKNINKNTNIFCLPYTTSNVIVQQLASNTVNPNPYSVPNMQGVIDINPPMDNWVDVNKAPDLLVLNPGLQILQSSNNVTVLSVGDWKTVPGTTLTPVSGSSSSKETTASSQSGAVGSSTYSINNNYVVDISILSYIRPQELLIKAGGLKMNTKLSFWFDGQNVDKYMFNPDVIELTGVTGNFAEGDIVGYYQSSSFYPIATIVSVYNYPSSSNTRLYVSSNFHTSYNSDIGTISSIQNAKFDNNGIYVSSSAYGNTTNPNIINVHKTGYVTSVGGNFVDITGSSVKYYSTNRGYGPYEIWSSANGKGTLTASNTAFTVPSTGTYYVYIAGDEDIASGNVKIDSTNIWSSPSNYGSKTMTLSSGTHYLSLDMGASPDNDGAVSIGISTSPWTSKTKTSGTVIFTTRNIVGNTPPTNAGTEVRLPGGGLYYVGASKVSLSGIANTSNGFYTGSSITFKSIYVSTDLSGQATVTPQIFSANVTAYDATTFTATLSSPVNISIGTNSYVGGDINSSYSLDGTSTSYSLAIQSGSLSSRSTDESGSYVGIFNVPSNTFKVGQRVFRADNRTNPIDPSTATTYAEGIFTASGLSSQAQPTNFSSSISAAKTVVTATNNAQNTQSLVDPLAQSFNIQSANFPNGIFLDSVTLFFKSKPTTINSPVTLSIVGTLNGYPDGETLDYSIVTLTADKVNVSDAPSFSDSNTKTRFAFSAPVYIQPGVNYAIVLTSPSSDYSIWIAAQDSLAISSTANTATKIGASPYVGSMFESQNSILWTADPNKYFMMVVDRCVFDTTSNPSINFVVPTKLPTRKPTTDDVKYFIDPYIGGNLLNSYVNKDVNSDAYNITTTDFVPSSTKINYQYNATLKSTKSYAGIAPVDPGKYGCPTYDDIYLSDGLGERILISDSNNSFVLSASLASSSDAVSPIISDDGLSLYNVEWGINNLGLSNSQFVITNEGAGYSSNSSNTFLVISAPDLAGGEQAYASANVANGSIQYISVTTPGSGYLKSPTVTVMGSNTTQANVAVISEFYPRGGNALCKYFTKKVVLAPGNDSQDLRVLYNAYRPIGTNIYIFYKLLNGADPSRFDDNGWQLMTSVGLNKNLYSKSRSDVIDYEAAPGANNTPDNYISYVGANGQVYKDFIQFAIKIVMTTNDNTTVPFLNNIRALALPAGTGI